MYVLKSSPQNRSLHQSKKPDYEPVPELADAPIMNMNEIINVDDIIDEPAPKVSSTLWATCNRYIFDFPDGQNPHTAYPFALHNLHSIPWDYSVWNGIMTLYSRSCDGYSQHGDKMSCKACQGLAKNGTLDRIQTRIKGGVSKNALLAYHVISSLLSLMQLQNIDKEFYWMRGLNQTKKLLGKATTLSDHKYLLIAMASGKVARLDAIIQIGLQQKKGVKGLLASLEAAAQGLYRPKSFTEDEDMRMLLFWRLGGNQVANIYQHSLNGPSVSYLRRRSIVPAIIPSHAQPTIEQVRMNVDLTFESIASLLQQLGRLHVVAMFDEGIQRQMSFSEYVENMQRRHQRSSSMKRTWRKFSGVWTREKSTTLARWEQWEFASGPRLTRLFLGYHWGSWHSVQWLVLGSPVQSSFSSKFGKTETETGPPSLEMLKKPDWTFRDWSTAVFGGFLRLKDQSEPVMV